MLLHSKSFLKQMLLNTKSFLKRMLLHSKSFLKRILLHSKSFLKRMLLHSLDEVRIGIGGTVSSQMILRGHVWMEGQKNFKGGESSMDDAMKRFTTEITLT